MANRLFVAINLPEEIKNNLLSFQERIGDLFPKEENQKEVISWTKKENLHITMVFLGYVVNKKIGLACKVLEDIGKRHNPFSLNLKQICCAPPDKKIPRMIWVKGKEEKNILDLKKDIDNSLFKAKILRRVENRKFTPHITLGRIRKWQWEKIIPGERPKISEEISLSSKVGSIELMESKLKRGEPEYSVVESVKLNKKQ